MGSAGDDVALCAEASQDHVVIAGYTTDDLYSENNGNRATCKHETIALCRSLRPWTIPAFLHHAVTTHT